MTDSVIQTIEFLYRIRVSLIKENKNIIDFIKEIDREIKRLKSENRP
jgi:hypothetical protein